MSKILDKIASVFGSEPAVIIALVDAALVLAVAFGAPIDASQKAAVDAFLAVVAGIAIRSQVSPVSSIPAAPVIAPASTVAPAASEPASKG